MFFAFPHCARPFPAAPPEVDLDRAIGANNRGGGGGGGGGRAAAAATANPTSERNAAAEPAAAADLSDVRFIDEEDDAEALRKH